MLTVFVCESSCQYHRKCLKDVAERRISERMVTKLQLSPTSGAMLANTVVTGNKSRCLPQMKANKYLKLLSPVLFLIALFAILQVLLLTTAETSSSAIGLVDSIKTTTTTTTTKPTTRSPKWFEVWKNGDSFLQMSPEVLSPRSRRSRTTIASPLQLSNSTTVQDNITTSRPQNVTNSQISAPELHVTSGSEKAVHISTSSMDEPQADSTVENLTKQDKDDGRMSTNLVNPQKEVAQNDPVYNRLDKGYDPRDANLPAGVDIGELVPGSFEGLVGADEDLNASNDNDGSSLEPPEDSSLQQPEASELVLDEHSNHIGPSLETIIHDDKTGDIRAQVGLSLHYKPSHSSVHDAEEPDDGANSAASGGLVDVANDGEAIAGSNNEQQQNYRSAKRRLRPNRPEEHDIGRVIVGVKRHQGPSHSSRPKKQMTIDLNTAAGHYYGKKKKKMMYKKKKMMKKKLKKKRIIIVKKKNKKKKYMKKKKIKKYKVKKYKKKKIVIIKKKKKRRAKKYHHHHHHHGGGGGGHGHGHGYGKYYMYAKVPKKKSWEFGFKRGNKKHWIERHEKGHKNKFKTKVKWYDAKSKGKGIHVWDYNHHDKKKKKHYG